MPGLNGLDVVAELRRRGREVASITLVTAAADPPAERRAAELGIRRVLRKPLANRLLLSALGGQLDG